MRWRSVWPLPLLVVACQRDFSVSHWTGGEAGALDHEGGRSTRGGTESAEPSAGAAPYDGGAGSGGQTPTVEGGTAGATSEANGRAGEINEPVAAGSGGMANQPPVARFDVFRFKRGVDVLWNASAGAGGESGGGSAGASDPGVPAYGFDGSEQPLAQNDFDPDGDALRVEPATSPTTRGGAVVIDADGGFAYTPPSERFWGDDYFEYTLTDGVLESVGRARVTLSVPEDRMDELVAGDGNGWVVLGSDAYTEFGALAASAGDVNGDGRDDLIAHAYNPASGEADALYVLFGREEATPVLLENLDGAAANGDGFFITGFRRAYHEGRSISGAGDLNGDRLDDLVISGLSSPAAATASVYVVFGRLETSSISLADIDTAGGTLGIRIDPAKNSIEELGTAVAAAGDMNGDGFGDLVIGAPGAARGSAVAAGAAYVLLGHTEFGKVPIVLSDVALGLGSQPGFVVRGIRANLRAGFSAASAGDVNADGLDDLVIGAPERPLGLSDRGGDGAAYVVFGAPNRVAVDLDWLESGRSEGFAVRGNYRSSLGYSVSSAGHFDTDTFADVLAGVPYYSNQWGYFMGGLYVALGRAEADPETLKDGSPTDGPPSGFLGVEGASARLYGLSVTAGDFDGDGWSDVATAGISSGVYLVFGGEIESPVLSLEHLCADANTRGARAFCIERGGSDSLFPVVAGDFNGDGVDDVYVGAAYSRPAGAGYVVFGWDRRGQRGASALARSGGRADDTLELSGDRDILRFSGGNGFDTIALAGPGFTWDLRGLEPSRLESIERIDLSAPSDYVLVLDDEHIRGLPSAQPRVPSSEQPSAPNLPDSVAKTLIVLGDAGDTVQLDRTNFEELGERDGRLLYRRRDGYYGLELAAAITVEDPPD